MPGTVLGLVATVLVVGLTPGAGSAGPAHGVGGAAPAAAAGRAIAALPPVPAAMACEALPALDLTRVPGAPTRLDSVRVVSDTRLITRRGEVTLPPYCEVKGYVAAQVRFELRLPMTAWTQRFLMLGCGGYCGGPVSVAPGRSTTYGCAPVENGEFAMAATDAGHVRAGTRFADGLWALDNPDAVADFAYRSTHKVTLASKAIIERFYQQRERYSYFMGCSNGGRQAFQQAQRYPDDYDGIVAGAPTIDQVATNTFYHAWNVRVNSRPDGSPILTADKIPGLHRAVLAACGRDNGGAGDMLVDPRSCDFDPYSVVCAGADGPECLTAEQARVVRLIYRGPADEHGHLLSPGDMPKGSELGWIGSMVPQRLGDPITEATAGDYLWSTDFPRFMARFGGDTGITNQNIRFTHREFDHLHQLTGIWDATNPDLRPFLRSGGRLLVWQGWFDTGTSPFGTLNYYDAVRRLMGSRAAGEVMALYMVPGVYHCGTGPTGAFPDAATLAFADYLGPTMEWVETGTRPDRIDVGYFATDPANPATNPNPRLLATRPVFRYPATARYDGSGDAALAENWVRGAPVAGVSDRLGWLGLRHYTPEHQQWFVNGPRLVDERPRGA